MHHPEQFRMMAKTYQKDRLNQALAERKAAQRNNSHTQGWMVRLSQGIVDRVHLIGHRVSRQGMNTVAGARALWHDIA